MKNEDILVASLRKVRENGFNEESFQMYMEQMNCNFPYRWDGSELIFSHDFAKAFWGDEFEDDEVKYVTEGLISGFEWEYLGKRWQWHLQQMVLEVEPIKYLERFL